MTINRLDADSALLRDHRRAVTPLGGYMTRVFTGERTFLSPVCGPWRAVLYGSAALTKRASSIGSLIGRHAAVSRGGFVFLYALLRLQAVLPFNPAGSRPLRRTSPSIPR